MSIEQQLRAALRAESEATTAPAPDLDALVAGGAGRRRRRVVGRAAVAAAAVVVLAAGAFVATRVGGDDHAEPAQSVPPKTVADLPVGRAPFAPVPHCVDGMLGPTRCMTISYRNGAALAFGRDDEGVYLVSSTHDPIPLAPAATTWFPTLSADGRYAAWVADNVDLDGERKLLVYALHNDSDAPPDQVAELSLDASVPVGPGAVWTAGIDSRHRVYLVGLSGAAEVSMYDIDSGELLAVQDVPEHIAPGIRYVTGEGFGIQALGGTTVYGTVDDDGRFHAGSSASPGLSNWSADGSQYVAAVGHDVVIGRKGGRGTSPLTLPQEGAVISLPIWESEDTVLMTFDPAAGAVPLQDDDEGPAIPSSETYVLRCYTDSAKCEIAMQPGWGGDFAGPAYR